MISKLRFATFGAPSLGQFESLWFCEKSFKKLCRKVSDVLGIRGGQAAHMCAVISIFTDAFCKVTQRG